MRALVYCRVSLDQRGDARSVNEQETESRAWADREGWTVARVISETGSASRFAKSTKARSHWDTVVAEIQSGAYDILLTWEASRATRDLAVYADLRDLCAAAGVLWGYSGTVYDLQARGDRFRTGLDALLSEDESHRTSDRIKRSVRARAQAGAPHGKLPYGYRREYDTTTGALLRQVPNEETAPIVREIYRRVAGGEGLHTIAVDLTRRGIAPPRPARSPRAKDGQAWLASTVKRIALNPTNVGQRTHQGVIVGDATWPALVDRATFDKAHGILTQPGRLTRGGDSTARWLLSGIATCGIPGCGGPMRIYTNRGTKTYTCHWCFKVTRRAEPVDQHVSDLVVELLAHINTGPDDRAPSPELDDARAELDALRTRLESFTDAASEGQVTPAALGRIEAKLRPQIHLAQLRVAQLSAPAALSRFDLTDPQAFWGAASMADKREVLRAAVRVVIHPAGRGKRIFDPSLVEVSPAW
jgi:site-specific DNA recombinase